LGEGSRRNAEGKGGLMNMTDEFTKDMDAKYEDALASKEQEITDLKANHKDDVAYATKLRERIKELEATKNGIDNLGDQLYKAQKNEIASLKAAISQPCEYFKCWTHCKTNSDLKAKLKKLKDEVIELSGRDDVRENTALRKERDELHDQLGKAYLKPCEFFRCFEHCKTNRDLKAKIARTITWVEINSPASAGMVRKILRGD
jgi:hypothetical protein